MTALILFGSIFGQSESLEIDDPESSTSLQGAFGAVTIDGKIWNQIALRPTLPFGKLSVAFDMVLYIDQDGNIHDDDWDFSSGEKVKNTIIDKIYYIRYGNRWDKNYFKIGALDNVTMGYGILLNRYTNTLLYPQVRKVGMEFKTRAFGVNIHGFTNDFKENMGLAGLRISAPVDYGITAGVTWVGDRNQYLGLRMSRSRLQSVQACRPSWRSYCHTPSWREQTDADIDSIGERFRDHPGARSHQPDQGLRGGSR